MSQNSGVRRFQRAACAAAAKVNEGIKRITTSRFGTTLDHLADRDHQSDGGVGDGQALPYPTEHLIGNVPFESGVEGAEVAEDGALFHLAQTRRRLR